MATIMFQSLSLPTAFVLGNEGVWGASLVVPFVYYYKDNALPLNPQERSRHLSMKFAIFANNYLK